MQNELVAVRGGACEVAYKVPEKSAQENLADSIGVSTERLEEMQEYARQLRKKFPHMKEDRITKKVAAYFKVKLK